MSAPSPWTDAQILTALDLRDVERLTATEIAARLGFTKGQVCGQLFRTDQLADAEEIGQAVAAPENRDGALPRKWWAAGIRARPRGTRCG